MLKKTLLDLKDVEDVVLGWPLHFNGTLSPLCKEVEELKSLLEKNPGIKVHLMDERLTTKIAEESYRSHGYSRKARKAHLDQAAAVLILNAFLEKTLRSHPS